MAYKTITLIGDPIHKEYKAAAAITPGMLCELASTGKGQAHSTAGGTAQKMFALEDELRGKGIGDAYTTDNMAQFGIFNPGDEVYALLANGEVTVVGSKLESNGDGYMRVVDADASVGDIAVQSVVLIAMEVLDMSGSSGEDPESQRIRCEVM